MSTTRFTYAPMRAGKTADLIHYSDLFKEAGNVVCIVRPSMDTRAKDALVVSRNGESRDCYVINDTRHLLNIIKQTACDAKHLQKSGYVFVDEVQFMDGNGIASAVYAAKALNVNLMLYGLMFDANGRIFEGSMAAFAATDDTRELIAMCECCGKHRARLTLLKDGFPEASDNNFVLIGDEEYIRKCPECITKDMVGA